MVDFHVDAAFVSMLDFESIAEQCVGLIEETIQLTLTLLIH